MLYEIHMLKNYPPTNLNRDDTCSPKTCLFGGGNRGRISSQCLKRSWRTSDIFRQAVGEENLGIRTRMLPSLVVEKLLEMGVSPAYADMVGDGLYGAKCPDKGLEGQCLHARRLHLIHPVTGEELRFESALPEYFISVLDKLGTIERKGETE